MVKTQKTTAPSPVATQWHDATDARGIPARMLCPVTRSIMHDPVVASDENTYDRPVILRLLAEANVFEPAASPWTREPLTSVFSPNAVLRREIEGFLAANPHLQEPLEPQQREALRMAQAQGVPAHMAKAALMSLECSSDSAPDLQLADLLAVLGFKPPSQTERAQPYARQPLDAPSRRRGRQGRLAASDMQRDPPRYGVARQATAAPLGANAQGLSVSQSDVRRVYQMAPETPSPMPLGQLGVLTPVTRVWSSPSSRDGTAAYVLHRATAVGSLAGAYAPLASSPTTRLTAGTDQTGVDIAALTAHLFGVDEA